MYLLTHLFFITIDQVAFLFIDILLQQLQNRYRSVSALLNLMPPLMIKLGMPPPEQFESWHDDLLTPRTLDNEVSRWLNIWSRQSDRADLPDTLMKSLASPDQDTFPNIIILLVLRCIL